MATRYNIPGVSIREIDNSDYVAAISTTTLALVGVARKGPLHKPTLVTSAEEFVRIFGAPPSLLPSVNEQQVIQITPGATGTFTLTFDGQTTGAITLSGPGLVSAATVQTALNALSNIGASGVTVTGDSGILTVTFARTSGTSPTAARPQPLLTGTAGVVRVTRQVAGRGRPGDYAAHAAISYLKSGRILYFVRTCAVSSSNWLARVASTPASGLPGTISFAASGTPNAIVASASSPGEWANGTQLKFTKLEGNRNRIVKWSVARSGSANISSTFTATIGGTTGSTQTFVGTTEAALQTYLNNLIGTIDPLLGEAFIVTGATATTSGAEFTIEYDSPLDNTDVVPSLSFSAPTNGTSTLSVVQAGRACGTNVYRLDVLAPVDLSGRLDIVESYPRVMLVNDPDLLSLYNAEYLAKIVNSGVPNVQSASTYITIDETTMPLTTAAVTKDVSGTYTMFGGFSAMNTASGSNADFVSAYVGVEAEGPQASALLAAGPRGLQALASRNSYLFNMLAIPGVSDGGVVAAMIRLVEGRGDAITIIDPPSGLSYANVIDWHNQSGAYADSGYKADSSYAAIYWPWVVDYDPYNRTKVTLPPSCVIPGVHAFADLNDAPWAAPAGLINGRVSALDLESPTPSDAALEQLMTGGNVINPIVSNPREGIVVWGQRTTQRRPTSLDRLNVRKMVLAASSAILPTLRSLVFRPNDELTRQTFIMLVTPKLEEIKRRRGIYEYRVICDESTNPPDQVDRYVLRGVLLVKPTKTAEQIIVDFTLLSTGAEFSLRQ